MRFLDIYEIRGYQNTVLLEAMQMWSVNDYVCLSMENSFIGEFIDKCGLLMITSAEVWKTVLWGIDRPPSEIT